MGVMSGQYECVIAGGVENMSRVPMGSNATGPGDGPLSPRLQALYNIVPQGISAEMLAEKWGLKREELDKFSARATRRRAGPSPKGASSGRSRPITLPDGSVFDADEGRARARQLGEAGLARAVLQARRVVTAGNSSQISDGAAALLIMSEARAKALKLTPRARIVATVAGRRGPDHHADRSHSRHPAGAQEGRAQDRPDRPLRDQRGLRLRGAGVGA